MTPSDRGTQNCVLVVEDEEDAREMMREIVEMGGCSVVVAANGLEALKVLSSCRPCLIVVDLLMPVMNGVQFLEELRRHPSLADIPVVVATSAPDRAPQGTPVLTKPIDMKALWGWMRRSCSCSCAAEPLRQQ